MKFYKILNTCFLVTDNSLGNKKQMNIIYICNVWTIKWLKLHLPWELEDASELPAEYWKKPVTYSSKRVLKIKLSSESLASKMLDWYWNCDINHWRNCFNCLWLHLNKASFQSMERSLSSEASYFYQRTSIKSWIYFD